MSAAVSLSLTACSDNNTDPDDEPSSSKKSISSSVTEVSTSEDSGENESSLNGGDNSDSKENSSSGGSSGSSSSSSSSSSSGSSSGGNSKPSVVYDEAYFKALPENPGSEFTYEILAEGIAVTGYTGANDVVKVPAVIDGEPVREVHIVDNVSVICPPDGVYAFSIPSSAVAAYIPGNFEIVYNWYSSDVYGNSVIVGILGIDNLESITFGSGIKKIQGGFGCKKLKTINLPEGLELVGPNAFKGSRSLESVVIPSSVKIISTSAFEGCTNLKEVYNIPENAKVYNKAFDGSEFLKNRLAQCPESSFVRLGASIIDGSKCTGDVVIPEGVEVINEYAFAGNRNEWGHTDDCDENDNITSVTIPSTVTEIDKCAFSHCDRLKTVTINGSPTVYEYAFSTCLRLETVNCTGTPKVGGGESELVTSLPAAPI